MFKTRNFYLMKIYTVSGKYLGVVSDILIDFENGKIIGFFIGGFKIFKKNRYINAKNIISIEDIIIVSEVEKCDGLKFSAIKNMDIINGENLMKGVLEDLVIDIEDLTIKALIISSGIFDTMIKGKELLLINSCVLCDQFIIYIGKENIKFKILPQNLGGKKNEISQ